MLSELVRNSAVIGFLVNPNFGPTEANTRDVQAAADAIGQKLVVVKASTTSEFEPAFTAFVQQRIGALFIQANPLFDSHPEQLVALIAPCAAGGLPIAGSRRGRRPDEIWKQRYRFVSPARHLHWSDSQG